MSYLRSQKFQPGTFLRPCDLCGIRFRDNELVRGDDNFWRCKQWCQEQTQLSRDRIVSQSQRRKEAPPPPHGIPFGTKQTYAEEAYIFNVLCELPVRDAAWTGGFRTGAAPASIVAVTDGGPGQVGSANLAAGAQTARYLYDLITENKRPSKWITTAKAKLRELADWMITKQVGFGENPSATPSSTAFYGGFHEDSSTQFAFQTVAECGLAMIYAHRIFGGVAYLASAEAAANFLRNGQAVGSAATRYTSADAAGLVRLYLGAVPQRCSSILPFTTDHRFAPTGLVALEFWTALLAIVGDRTYGAPIAIAGSFTNIPAAALSTSIADCRAFWEVGAYDAVVGSIVNGFTPETPRQLFNAYSNSSAFFPVGTGSWEFSDGNASVGTQITSSFWATGLRSLFALDGYSARVAANWTWLMAFNANPAFETAPGTLPTDYACASTTLAANPSAPPTGQGNRIPPSYDPSLALASALLVRDSANGFAPIAMNATSIYDWSTTGYMAAIQSSRNQAALRRAKDALTAARLRLPATFVTDQLTPIAEHMAMLRGQTGLAFQTNTASLFWVPGTAAVVGNVFRHQPQSWTGMTAPQQQPGLGV